MSVDPATATVRELVDELGRRLARIGAAASSLHSMSADLRRGVPPTDVMVLLRQIERELALASQQLELVEDRAARQIDALTPQGDTP
jgi:hypothetical protein